jgi:hypothetical protein
MANIAKCLDAQGMDMGSKESHPPVQLHIVPHLEFMRKKKTGTEQTTDTATKKPPT